MQVTRACAEDLNECVHAAVEALRRLDDSVEVLRWELLNDEDQRAEEQLCLDEAARFWDAAQTIAGRVGLGSALRELQR